MLRLNVSGKSFRTQSCVKIKHFIRFSLQRTEVTPLSWVKCHATYIRPLSRCFIALTHKKLQTKGNLFPRPKKSKPVFRFENRSEPVPKLVKIDCKSFGPYLVFMEGIFLTLRLFSIPLLHLLPLVYIFIPSFSMLIFFDPTRNSAGGGESFANSLSSSSMNAYKLRVNHLRNPRL